MKKWHLYQQAILSSNQYKGLTDNIDPAWIRLHSCHLQLVNHCIKSFKKPRRGVNSVFWVLCRSFLFLEMPKEALNKAS